MRRVAVETRAAVVVMHIQGQPRVANPNPVYGDVVEEVADFLTQQAGRCIEDGIQPDRIVVDPGPGFGKTPDQDLAVIRGLERLSLLQYPLLLAVSRKKFIGETLGLGVEDRLEGSLAVTAWAVMKGARIVRAHDVRDTRRVILMTEAVMNPEVVEDHG
jgi:dihydropteroate synthase